jgi:hypothetical protein
VGHNLSRRVFFSKFHFFHFNTEFYLTVLPDSLSPSVLSVTNVMLSPWGRRIPDFSGSKLSFDQKTWLVERVNTLEEAPAQLQSKHNILQDTIRKWVRIMNSRKHFFPNGYLS